MDGAVVDPRRLAAAITAAYENVPVAAVDDHVVRLSVMTERFHWHRHPDADELFVGVEGRLLIETDDGRVELEPGQLHVVTAGVAHVTAPLTARTVNLTVERGDMTTEPVKRP